MNLLNHINDQRKQGKKLLAILIDPDKVVDVKVLIDSLKQYPPDLIFVGGSRVDKETFDQIIKSIYDAKICPVVIFPGDYKQVNDNSDAILLLSLISGRNPEYLIEQHVKAAKTLDSYKGEVIPTSYVLIDGNRQTSVQEVSKTKPISQENIDLICDTIIAGRLMGHKIHYLEAGSGANNPVSVDIVKSAKEVTDNPIIVGGGIKDIETAKSVWNAGADLIVVGNGFEDKVSFLQELRSVVI